MDLPEFLTNDADGEIRLAGHRISLYSVIDRYQEGFSPEMLAEEYPTLPLALIYHVIAFYLDHQQEVDEYVAAYGAELERQEAEHPVSPALERIRRRLAMKRQAEAARRLGAQHFMLQYVLDEDIRGVLWRAIQRHNLVGDETLNVIRVGDEPELPLGSLDPANLLWAEKANRILVSRDKKTLPGHFEAHLRAGHHSPGIFLVRKRCSIPEVIGLLVEAAYRSDPSEWRDRIEYIP